MTKRVIPRASARRDVEAVIDHLVAEASSAVAINFADELRRSYAILAEHPAIGSQRYGFELAIPGLRSLGLRRFPYLVFYVDRDTHVDVWRVLHARRDIPDWLAETDAV